MGAQNTALAHLFTRDGHVSELTYDRWQAGELADEEQAAVGTHTERCPGCAAMVKSLHDFDAKIHERIVPPGEFRRPERIAPNETPDLGRHRGSLPTQDRSGPRRRGASFGGWSRRLLAGGLSLAAAAAAAILVINMNSADVTSPSGDDGIRIKGTHLSLEVFVDRAGEPHGLVSGEQVHPGERLGFRVQSRVPGHIMIVGVDDKNQGYLCYPQKRHGEASQTKSMKERVTLGEAVRLDDTLGKERLLLVQCEDSFTFEDIQDDLSGKAKDAGEGPLPALREGCAQKEVLLVKVPR